MVAILFLACICIYMATYGTMFCKLPCIYVCMPKNTLHKVKMFFCHAYVYTQQLTVQCFVSCCAYTYAHQTIDIYTYIHGNNHSFCIQTGEEKNDSLFTSVLAQIVNVPEVYNVKHLRTTTC